MSSMAPIPNINSMKMEDDSEVPSLFGPETDIEMDRALSGMRDLPDPLMEQALDNATLKIGGADINFDTGISLSKGMAAGLAGFGDQIGDSWRGIKQGLTDLGIVDLIDEEQQNVNEELLRALFDSQYGGEALTGGVFGALTEPVGLLLPVAKAKTAAGALMWGATLGGIYGSTLYVDKDESRIGNAILVGSLMGPMGVAAHGLGAYFRNLHKPELTEHIADASKRALSREEKPGYILTTTQKVEGKPHLKLKLKLLEELEAPKTPEKVAARAMEDMEARVTMRGPRAKRLAAAREKIDQWLQPLYNNIKKYSDVAARGLRRVDYETHRDQKIWTDQILDFDQFMKRVGGEVEAKFQKVLYNEGLGKTAIAMAREHGGEAGVNSLMKAKKVLDEIAKEYKGVGYKLGGLKDYFPRAVRNLEQLAEHHRSIIDQALSTARSKTKNGKLSAGAEARIIERLLTNDPRFSTTSGSLKKRLIKEIPEDQLTHYHAPSDSLYYYLHTAAEDIANRKFFSSFGHKPGAKGLDITGGDIDKAISSLMDQMKHLSWREKNDMVKLLRSRFAPDVHNTEHWIQALKNLSYAGTLGNFWSAMTQVGDLIFAFHKYGVASTVESLFGAKVTDKVQLGIQKAMTELNSEKMLTSKIADWAFKWGGFDAVDSFGKNININASLRANKKLAIKNPEKFKARWGDAFPRGEVDNLMFELRNLKLSKGEKLSDNAKLMLWNDLADTQPIGLSEMPQKYLDMPNGRVFYAYKTFTLKQLNYMRETLMRGEGNEYQRAYNLMKFGTMFVLANGTIDYFKDFLLGRDLDITDNFLDNVAGILGSNKYAVDKHGAKLGSLIFEGFKPVPYTQLRDTVDVLGQAMTGEIDLPKASTKIPVIGKPGQALQNWEARNWQAPAKY